MGILDSVEGLLEEKSGEILDFLLLDVLFRHVELGREVSDARVEDRSPRYLVLVCGPQEPDGRVSLAML